MVLGFLSMSCFPSQPFAGFECFRKLFPFLSSQSCLDKRRREFKSYYILPADCAGDSSVSWKEVLCPDNTKIELLAIRQDSEWWWQHHAAGPERLIKAERKLTAAQIVLRRRDADNILQRIALS